MIEELKSLTSKEEQSADVEEPIVEHSDRGPNSRHARRAFPSTVSWSMDGENSISGDTLPVGVGFLQTFLLRIAVNTPQNQAGPILTAGSDTSKPSP